MASQWQFILFIKVTLAKTYQIWRMETLLDRQGELPTSFFPLKSATYPSAYKYVAEEGKQEEINQSSWNSN